ncbi:MAG TPA: glycosyltransferase [Ilumatobacteraceae bacterium]|nr:glycosyltransferase [Ilumatobacteraceae bacterium]
MSANGADALAGRTLLLISAFDPLAVGNGSSLRAQRWCDTLAASVAPSGHFDAVVVPVVYTPPTSPYRRLELPGDDEIDARAALLAQPRWRDWMVRASPLPPAAASAPPWMGRELLGSLGHRPDAVVAFKMALAPMAADLAAECGAALLVDVDDDEPSLALDVGSPHADALERLLRGVSELADVMTLAAPTEAAAVASRVAGRGDVAVVPNVVDLPPVPPPGEAGRVVYIANFDYQPNRVAARWLLDDVMPHVRGDVRLDLVGPFGDLLQPGAPGLVPDVAPYLTAASVVVCPLLHGAGTSIKVLEAMAYGRPVVTTSIGIRGLDVVPDEHVLVADDAPAFGAAVSSLLADRDAATAMGMRARDLVARRYSSAVGADAMVSAVAAALGRR